MEWLDKYRIKLSQLSTKVEVKVEAEIGNNEVRPGFLILYSIWGWLDFPKDFLNKIYL